MLWVFPARALSMPRSLRPTPAVSREGGTRVTLRAPHHGREVHVGALDGRIVIVTGAGRGIGRAHALMLASEGAKVVVNDVGAAIDGTGGDAGPAHQVVDEI